MTKTNIGVFFGSRAAEHDVSIVSGLQLLENIDKTKYDAYPVYVSRAGGWYVGDPLNDIKTYRRFDPSARGITEVYLPPVPGKRGLYGMDVGGFFKKGGGLVRSLDCAVLAFHGMHGEDGTMQGLFELCDIPYTSVGVTGAGVGMDKIIMKAVFKSMGLPVLESAYFYRSRWQREPDAVLREAKALGYPLFVKPANLGSSIGISKAVDLDTLKNAIEVAASYDRRILVERGVNSPREINCAGLGYYDRCLPSVCEQPASMDAFLSFEDKYTRGGKGDGMQSLKRQIPAPIDEATTKRIQDMTADIFKMLECKGVVRIDYIIDEDDGTVYVNEINTIPGSFAFYLYEPMGIKYSALIDKLIAYAFAAREEKLQSVFAFDSELLQKVALGGAGLKSGKTTGKI
ncbi:MAG: D-alanine--D-alanine ligase [Clostridiales bacterium]|nr:D-alanine--D-alanine ligase [Clostridiales bacterium]